MAYTDRDGLGEIAGPANVTKYATRDPTDDADDITAAITAAIAWADAMIDGMFRGGPYVVPFSPVPVQVEDWSKRLAIFKLYQARGTQDESDDLAGQFRAGYDDAIKEMGLYASGSLRLNHPEQHTGPTAPVAVR